MFFLLYNPYYFISNHEKQEKSTWVVVTTLTLTHTHTHKYIYYIYLYQIYDTHNIYGEEHCESDNNRKQYSRLV